MAKIQQRKIKQEKLQQLLDDKAVSNYAIVHNDEEKNFAKDIFTRQIEKRHDLHIYDVEVTSAEYDVLLIMKRNKLDESLYFKDAVLERKLKSSIDINTVLDDYDTLNWATFDPETVTQEHFQQIADVLKTSIEYSICPSRMSIVHIYNIEKPALLLMRDMNESFFEEEK